VDPVTDELKTPQKKKTKIVPNAPKKTKVQKDKEKRKLFKSSLLPLPPSRQVKKVQKRKQKESENSDLLLSENMPEPSDIARDRKIRQVKTGETRKHGFGQSEAVIEPLVSPQQRLIEFLVKDSPLLGTN
jgi:hypothetical protein